MAKLYANGRAALHIDDDTYEAGEDGTIEVAAHHVELALAHGATREDPAMSLARAPDTGDLAGRATSLEAIVSGLVNRVAALESLVKSLLDDAARKRGK